MTPPLITIESGALLATINPLNQQLCRVSFEGNDWFHGGGLPSELQGAMDKTGWNQTEIVMFPVVGPVRGNAMRQGAESFPMVQHGIVRHRTWELRGKTPDSVTHEQTYVARTPVPNNKIEAPISWPFSFRIERTYSVSGPTLLARFRISNESEKEMPFAIGWHPAFRTLSGGNEQREGWFVIHQKTGDRRIEMDEVLNASTTGALVKECTGVTYTNGSRAVRVDSDFGLFMLWRPKSSAMVCIEPSTMHPKWEGVETIPTPVLQPGGETVFNVSMAFK